MDVKQKIKKNIQNIFKENKLNIVIQCNVKIVNYLYVSLNLNNSNCMPHHKPDNKIFYTHKDSNHPRNIIKHPTKSYLTNQRKITKKL